MIAQRLVRRICPVCSTEYSPSPEVLAELNLTPREVKGRHFRYGKGCEACHHTGYKGRLAIFEILLVSERIRQRITENVSTDRSGRRPWRRECARSEILDCWPSTMALPRWRKSFEPRWPRNDRTEFARCGFSVRGGQVRDPCIQ